MTHLTSITAFPGAAAGGAAAAPNLEFFRGIAAQFDARALREIAHHAERHRFAAARSPAEADAKQALMRLGYAIEQVLALAEGTPPRRDD